MKHSRLVFAGILALGLGLVTTALPHGRANDDDRDRDRNRGRDSRRGFERVATFPVIENLCPPGSPNSCYDTATVSEIVDVSENGQLLIYTDALRGQVGFVDITHPSKPKAAGTLPVGGSPTSVAVAGKFALVLVDTTLLDAGTGLLGTRNGHLTVINMLSKSIVPGAGAIPLGGQPDSVAISPDRKYAAIVMENQRDEELGNGEPPQPQPGLLKRLSLTPYNNPAGWTFTDIPLVGVPDLFPGDPEPEFVDINDRNIAVVTLQENNHIVLVNLNTATVLNDFPAGSVNLTRIDTAEEGVINFNSSLANVPREPDAVAWISNFEFATADEGDLNGGSRGFTIFNLSGKVVFNSGSSVEHISGMLGHYPEDRSGNKGSEPEGIEYGDYGRDEFLFVGTERASLVNVYRLFNGRPEYVQSLPAATGPEGLKAIPHRKLFVVSSEEDDQDDAGLTSGRTLRAGISIYQLADDKDVNYPAIYSVDDASKTPVPWAALSGLGAHPTDRRLAYSVSDSAFSTGFIYPMDVSGFPAVIKRRIAVTGAADLDLEGVAVRSDGSLWLASEGTANGSRLNRLLAVNQNTGALLLPVVTLPPEVDARRIGNGFEGVAVTGRVGVNERVYALFQRDWMGDPTGNGTSKARIGIYNPQNGEWRFLYYPLEGIQSPNGGSMFLSELVALDNNDFAVIERDNQFGPDARVKRIYRFSISGLTPGAECDTTAGAPFPVCDFPTVAKRLVRDLLPDLRSRGGMVIEKVEGLAVTADGRTIVHTDNDGVDGSNGETQYFDLGYRVLR